jgi:type I restriction enzyme S subunit
MARGKKKESALSLEEKLERALVPESEQPYPIPGNWCWTKGAAIFLDMETRKPKGEYFHYIDIDAIDNTLQVVTEPKFLAIKDAPSRASRAVHCGDTVFSLVRPYLRNIAYIDDTLKECIASTGFYVCSPSAVLVPRYLYWLMTSSYVVDGLNQYMKGDNSPSIRKDDIEQFAYPIPPLAEQQRIVDRIERLFAQLDEAKEKAQAVVDSFETRKAAILHKAFTGELTAKWRAENGVALDMGVSYQFCFYRGGGYILLSLFCCVVRYTIAVHAVL